MAIDIVLVEPEIPQNTGNIARSCVATGSSLHLIEPLGFSIEDKQIKRAGLDYWHDLDVSLWNSTDDFMRWISDRDKGKQNIFYCTTKSAHIYTEVEYDANTVLFFGKESRGLPESLLISHPEQCIRIPMLAGKRSLNLSNAVAIVMYEVLRQQKFLGLQKQGKYGMSIE